MALTSPIDATGVFTFETPTGDARPVRGIGVDTTWELRLPKPANPFDFRTIADVLVTIDYTALDSPDYRPQVVRELDQTRRRRARVQPPPGLPRRLVGPAQPRPDRRPRCRSRSTTRRPTFRPTWTTWTIAHVALLLVTARGRAGAD